MSLPRKSSQDSRARGTGFTENILKAYLEMAESNLANGQILIDRIASLEKHLGCNDTKSRKGEQSCGGYHAGVSPDVLQTLIQRLTDEIPPQAELVSKIVELLTVLRARLEQRARDDSHQKRLSSLSEDIGMNDTGELDLSGLLQLNLTSIENGEVLINRIAELESELHNLKAHSSGASSGEEDCPKMLEEAQKHIQHMTAQIIDLNSELRTLKEHPAEARSDSVDCQRLSRAESENVTLLERIGTLESELHVFKNHSPSSPRGGKDCPKELEKAKEQLAELSATLKTREHEINEHQADLDWYEEFLEERDQDRDQAEDIRSQDLKNKIADLKIEVEKLKKEKLEVEKRLAECNKYHFETLQPLLEQRNDEINSLKTEINAKSHLENELVNCYEKNGKILAQLEAYWTGDTINANLERDHNSGDQAYQALLVKVKVLKTQLKDCEKARGNEVYDSDSELKIDEGRSEEEQEEYMNYLESLTRAQLIEMLVRSISFESTIAMLKDLNYDLMAQNESRQRMWIEQAGVTNSLLRDADTRYAEQNDVIAGMKDDIRNLNNALTSCREFKADVLKLGIDEPEEPRDLEGLDNEALIEEIIYLQRKLKTLGIKFKEAVKNEQTFESASELSEDLEMQNPRQELRELRATLEELRATIKQVREENEERIDNPEEAESMTILKKGIQKLRAEHDIAVENLKSSEEEVDRLIKTLQEQLDAREKDLQNEKEQAKKREESDAGKARQIADLQKQLDDCLASREGLQEQFDTEWRKRVEAMNEKKRADLEDLNEMIEEVKNSVRNEENIEEDLEQDCEEKIKALELQHTLAMVPLRRQIVELKDLLREALDAQPEAGPSPDTIAAAIEEARLSAIQRLSEQQDHCEAEKKELRKRIEYLETNLDTPQRTPSDEIQRLTQRIAQLEAEIKKAKYKAETSQRAAERNFISLEEEREKRAKCEEKLADLRLKHPTTGLGSGQRPASRANDEECLDRCLAELAKLKREMSTLKVERARLLNQLREQDDSGDIYQEGARRSTRNMAKRTQDKMNQCFERETSVSPLEENSFDGHNGACNDEIEALNNQITELKEKIEALEQKAALDKLEIDALKHGNTDKSEAHQKFSALIERLRAELADLQARLTDCANETWQERRARMRRLAAANRGPRGPTIHRLDPALAQLEEWNRSGWWKTERENPSKRRKTQ